LSEIGLGTWPIGGDEYGPIDDNECLRTIEEATDKGVNYIDTADVYGYGHAEELVGRAIRGRQHTVIISTKAGNNIYSARVPGGAGKDFSRSYLMKAVEGSLRRLGIETVPIFLLHNPPLETIREGEIFETLNLLRDQGKIRYSGLSVYTPAEALETIRIGKPHAVMLTFNLINQEARRELFRAAVWEGVGLLIRTPLGEGLLTGRYRRDSEFPTGDHRQDRGKGWLEEGVRKAEMLRFLERPNRSLAQAALAFVLAHDEITSVVPGAKNRAQLRENIAAAGVAFERDELEKVYRLHDEGFAAQPNV
jgi:aryl-alcohol dehydrogenase-like predicted oxidoreductase